MEMISRPCPVCGSTDESTLFADADFDIKQLDSFGFASRKMPEYMHYRLICCPVCDLLYASPIPKLSVLAKAYNEAAFDSSEEAHYASHTYGSFLPKIMQQLPDLDGAIDIGTGDGAFIEELIQRGFTNVSGVEPSKAPIASAKDDIRPLIKHDLFRAEDFQKGTFSLITCFQTLEHLHNPVEICRNVYTLLKDGGAFFLICHNHHALSAKILGRKSPIFDIEHLQLFSEESAKSLLERSGFVEIKTKVIFNCYPLHYWIKLFPLPLKIKPIFIFILKKIKLGYLSLSIPAGNITVIGYKKNKN